MGDIVQLAELRHAACVLIDWSENPPSPAEANWRVLENAVRAFQRAQKIGGPLGRAAADVISMEPDPNGERLGSAIETLRELLRIGSPPTAGPSTPSATAHL